LFITTQVINNKEVWHFSTRPKNGKMPSADSNKRDVFSTNLSGDAHMRGLRISLNNTFTAGGRSAPVFACIYGLSMAYYSKDAKIAKLYREKVFYPFVEDIRKNYYLMPEPIYYRVTKALEKLEHPISMDTTQVVKLPTHKKKSIIAGISKLPRKY
jgi:hypothetical protein